MNVFMTFLKLRAREQKQAELHTLYRYSDSLSAKRQLILKYKVRHKM